MKQIVFVAILTTLAITAFSQKTTTVFIVRHAEKDLSQPANTNPPLSGDGLQRSYDLLERLKKERISAVFSTNTQRTLLTGTPLANKIRKDIIPYDPSKNDELVTLIRKSYRGKKILIVGHSNTILTIVKAFGAQPSMTQIPDSQYNLLFEVRLTGDKASLTEHTYGR
jgi:2,3-bisphosphoglycerate-dependent phosphoglycerate mutase